MHMREQAHHMHARVQASKQAHVHTHTHTHTHTLLHITSSLKRMVEKNIQIYITKKDS
jgi:hypothetical protein